MNQYKERPPILSGPGGKAVSAVLWILGQIVFIIITTLLSKSRIDNSNPECIYYMDGIVFYISLCCCMDSSHIYEKTYQRRQYRF